jgi:hypothetical protein
MEYPAAAPKNTSDVKWSDAVIREKLTMLATPYTT